MSHTYTRTAEVLPFVPALAAVARVLDLIAWHKLLAIAHPEPALRLDGAHHERPVEFNLDPFLAKV